MQEVTLRDFIETNNFNQDQEITDLMLTDTDTLPDGWVKIGDGGHNGDYGDFGYVNCWATSDHRVIIFACFGLETCDEEMWSKITVRVAS